MQPSSSAIGLGLAVPRVAYTQNDVLDRLNVSEKRIRRLFLATQIEKRHFYDPPVGEGDRFLPETQGQLLERFKKGALDIGHEALSQALSSAGCSFPDLDLIAIVTSTGFMVPTLSAYFIKEFGLRRNCQRLDIVGMGCNAGLNGLNAVHGWCVANPGRKAALVCVEICSATYVNTGDLRAHVVNSLFGDGAAALILESETASDRRIIPHIIGFESHIIPEGIDSMRFDWDPGESKFSFGLHFNNPYVVGENVAIPVKNLLSRHKLRKHQIKHWIIHGGGKNVISAVKYNLGLTSHDVRHTSSIMRSYGNLSSASFLFSLEQLISENSIEAGDHGVMITMGPGAQIETALLRW